MTYTAIGKLEICKKGVSGEAYGILKRAQSGRTFWRRMFTNEFSVGECHQCTSSESGGG